VLYSRESNCGTYDFFKEFVLKGADFAPGTSYLAATAAVANSVAKEKNAIGFGGIAYFVKVKGAKVLPIRKEKDSPAVNPVKADGHVDFEAVQTGLYPISRPLHFYTPEAPGGEVDAFIKWCLGPAGQAIVEKEEYIPLAGDGAKG
jgi:phosphate transport system substrate-binding protein